MATSLRSRLWFSYAILLLAALLLSAIILAIFLPRSPLAYRPTYARLEAVQEMLLSVKPDLTGLPPGEMLAILKSLDATYQARILVFSSERELMADSRAEMAASQVAFRRPVVLRSNLVLRDAQGTAWLFHISRQPDGSFLLTGVERPRISLAALLANEIIPPFLVSGLASLALSLLVALALARWIGSPLEALVAASHRLPDLPSKPMPLRGPREIQELTSAYNQMTQRVHASQKAQREFVANVSHELKTPLTSIQGFAQALLDGTAGTPQERQRAAGIIQQEAQRMNRMVLDLLDLARMDGGTLDLQRREVDLAALLRGVVEKFSPQAEATGVSIQVADENLPPIKADGDRLAQVFSNLVDNALKFTRSGGSITLRARKASTHVDHVQVEIADDGAGIRPDALPHIFERFYQADTARRGGKEHGSGLGLAIAREIVCAHGGAIHVTSEVGKGSTFTVTLPVTGQTTPSIRP